LNKTVVSQGPLKERKKIETGSMATGADSSLVVVGKRGMTDDWALDTLVKKASKANKKITKASRLICVHSLPIKCLWVRWGWGARVW
jgi:hypothetical protein